MSHLQFDILPATTDDLDALVSITVDSFKDDSHTMFKEAAFGAGWFKNCMTEVTGQYIERMDNPGKSGVTLTVLKAVDRETGKIVGHVTWGQKVPVSSPDPVASVVSDKKESQEEPAEASETDQVAEKVENVAQRHPTRRRVADLEKLTGGFMNSFVQKHMGPGDRCLFICGINVHPDHQGKGVGKELISWGTSKADESQSICWVHLSQAGWPAFEKLGWQVEDTQTIDLDEFEADTAASGGSSGARTWGTYTFRCAVRQPVGIKSPGEV